MSCVYRAVHRLLSHHEQLAPGVPLPEHTAGRVDGMLEAIAVISGQPASYGRRLYEEWLAAARPDPCACTGCGALRRAREALEAQSDTGEPDWMAPAQGAP
ncbi:hypothetical protein [Streptomyces murinus]|uniref:hypothetical protein n=1 Tax=Streptomyces murinus TaxID=33900 RepID=UPI0038110FC8